MPSMINSSHKLQDTHLVAIFLHCWTNWWFMAVIHSALSWLLLELQSWNADTSCLRALSDPVCTAKGVTTACSNVREAGWIYRSVTARCLTRAGASQMSSSVLKAELIWWYQSSVALMEGRDGVNVFKEIWIFVQSHMRCMTQLRCENSNTHCISISQTLLEGDEARCDHVFCTMNSSVSWTDPAHDDGTTTI